ncbi:GIY-YIG nuclease family protein [Maritimibacter sp. HL-12]|uniref:GIY-YIG nuclease family protein n=1 Tax=Maritimibacter sp. HL-12 TaxID=1162418 RepID=UPI000A0F129D|nr:GIY-YIG nuclease family protein [Maritimibacter sp. HL-12]SMH56006.1 GIY-YIG catalytic domain-containing protein [Maritimibacter sp. HL-12]
MTNPIAFRHNALAQLTNDIGVYALCDLDNMPVYVGQSIDGIRTRVRRHLTSARSDIIANRQIDVWEIAFVRAWPVKSVSEINELESFLFEHFDSQKRLMNGTTLEFQGEIAPVLPESQSIQVIHEEELADRRQPELRLPRQISHYLSLVDYIQQVKNKEHLRRSLQAHFERLVAYHSSFLSTSE